MKRDPAALVNGPFDVVVVGGGFVGACVAWDAALRGWRVALLERTDFGAGVSANSLKILHGGLRYLQRLDVRRMRESIAERATWLRIAPHLVEPLPVLVPTRARGLQRKATLGAAVRVADGFFPGRNRGLHPDRRLPAGRLLSRAEALETVPELAHGLPDLDGAVLFHDAQLYSAERLVLEIVRAAAEGGATVVNHLAVRDALMEPGRIAGVRARDELTGDELSIRGRAVVVAAGDSSAELSARLTGAATVTSPACVGVNLVLNRDPPPCAVGVSSGVPDPSRRLGLPGRQLFVVPWRGRTMVGTGYYPVERPIRPGPADADELAARFLGEVRRAWPALSDARLRDVVRVHRGRLPARRARRAGECRLEQAARITDHGRDGAAGLFSVTAVKLTTARALAERVVDLVGRALGRPGTPCRTPSTLLPGSSRTSTDELRREAGRRLERILPPEVVDHLVRCYGRDYAAVAAAAEADARMRERVQDDSPVIRAQLRHAVSEEMACTPDDLLLRRTEIGARGRVSETSRRAAAEALAGPRPAGGGHA
ncbi:MAG: glycerol-3-phosphate dehydrogenase/oxidase [Gemmatimonadota bacterium]